MIGIIDYGVGNVLAFANMYKRMNVNVMIVREAEDILAAERLILPGVGSFDFAMSRLDQSGLRPILSEAVIGDKKPVLGVCVGMQMLAGRSDEGELPGLGWIDGEVRRFEFSELDASVPLPHMGWNNLHIIRETSLFKSLTEGAWFYYLHSYYFQCSDRQHEIACCEYGGEFTCAVNRDNVFGVQFHPEKSHEYGARLLRNFTMV